MPKNWKIKFVKELWVTGKKTHPAFVAKSSCRNTFGAKEEPLDDPDRDIADGVQKRWVLAIRDETCWKTMNIEIALVREQPIS